MVIVINKLLSPQHFGIFVSLFISLFKNVGASQNFVAVENLDKSYCLYITSSSHVKTTFGILK